MSTYTFAISEDITLGFKLTVEADSEEEAQKKADIEGKDCMNKLMDKIRNLSVSVLVKGEC